MAEISYDESNPHDPRITRVYWEQINNDDTAEAYLVKNERGISGSVQLTGTFGSATGVLQVSNDGTNYVTIEDVSGDAISLTAAGIAEFSTAALYIKPVFSGGDGTQDIDITMILRSAVRNP